MDITGQIIQLSVLIGALGVITKVIRKQVSKDNKELREMVRKMDYNNCKRALTTFISDVKRGIEKSDIEWQMNTEIYDHYIGDLEGNSFIKVEWQKIIIERK